MTLKPLLGQLKTAEYYLNLLFAFIPTLFIIQLWRYLSRFFDLGLSGERLVLYFILIYSLSPFFHFSLVKQLYGKIFSDESTSLLNPQPLMKIIFNKVYWPLILGQLPLVLLSISLFWYWLQPTVLGLSVFTGLIVLGFIYHFFFALSLALIFHKTKVTNWLDFFLRQEAYLWGGAYVPLIFFPDFLKGLIFKIPFAYSSLAGLLYLDYWPSAADFVPVLIYLAIFTLLSFWLIKKFTRYAQI